MLVVLGVVCWFAAIYIIPHTDPEKLEVETAAVGRASIATMFSIAFPAAEIQVKQLGGYSLEVWISRRDFESVGYLQRKGLIEIVGKGWCERYGGWTCPTVAVRDDKGGKELAVYHCLFSYATMEPQ